MIIKEIHIETFRAFKDISFKLGKRITAIAGPNATQKTTVLGMIGQPFSITQKDNPMFGCKTIDGYDFRSQFSEKFKFSAREQAGQHRWTLDLYDQVHFNNGQNRPYFIAESILRDKKSGALRIWNAEDRSHRQGNGFVQIPVYYLSLSRLYPIGEVSKTTTLEVNLSKEENDYCLRHYRNILHVMNIGGTPSFGVEVRNTKQKFAGVIDEKHDIFTNSAGEGNISRILLAMCSFWRLKKKHGDHYKGGILLIDELDATVYPFAQKELVKYLFDAANEFNVQVIFTTHSPIILESLICLKQGRQRKTNQSLYDASIVYLEHEYDVIKASNINSMPELTRCINDMDLTVTIPDKLDVYCEDAVATDLARYLLKEYDLDENFEFKTLSLGWTEYINLVEKNAFKICDSLLLLDRDVPLKEDYKKHKYVFDNNKNIMFLPLLVEEDLFKLLHDNENYKLFSEKFLKNASFKYSICFNKWPLDVKHYKVEDFKKWFEYVEKTVNRKTLFDFWLSRNIELANKFIKDVCDVHSILATKNKHEMLYPSWK